MIPPVKAVITDKDEATPHDPDSRMSGDQADMLRVLCEEAGEPFDSNLTQAQAVERIEVLREQVNKQL